MSERYGLTRKVLLRLEAACELGWVTYKVRRAPWAWTREQLRPVTGRLDAETSREVENAARSMSRLLPFEALCVPVTVTAMRMLRRRGVNATPKWVPPGARGSRGHVTLQRVPYPPDAAPPNI